MRAQDFQVSELLLVSNVPKRVLLEIVIQRKQLDSWNYMGTSFKPLNSWMSQGHLKAICVCLTFC